jgi:hypothetical protein
MVQTRRGLEIIIDAASTLYDFKSMQRLAEGVLTQLASLLNVDCAGILCCATTAPRKRILGAGGLGLLQPLHRTTSSKALDPICGRWWKPPSSAARTNSPTTAACFIAHGIWPRGGGAAAGERQLSDTDRALVEIFSSRLSIAFDNVILYRQLHEANTQLEDRVAQRTRALMQANRRLSAQWLRLQRANGFKNEILGTVAHDLKNPLGVILGRTEMLTELIGAGSPNGKRHRAGRAYPGRHQAPDLDGRPSDFGCDGGRLRHHHPPRTGRYRSAGGRGHRFEPAFGGQQAAVHQRVGAANFVTMCDADRIREAIDNLVSNAIKYSPIGGKITVGVSHESSNTVIRITDQAPDCRRKISAGCSAGSSGCRPSRRPGKLDRPWTIDRQTYHRHAWRPCDRGKRRPRTGIDVLPLHCPRQRRHDPEPAYHHRRRRGAGPRDGRRLPQDARFRRHAVRRRQKPAQGDRDQTCPISWCSTSTCPRKTGCRSFAT